MSFFAFALWDRSAQFVDQKVKDINETKNQNKFLEKYLAFFVNDIEYKRIKKKLEKYDLIADFDDQRFHHSCS